MFNFKLMQRTVFKWSNWLDKLLKRKLELPWPFILQPQSQPQPELLSEVYYAQANSAFRAKANKHSIQSLSKEENAWLAYIK